MRQQGRFFEDSARVAGGALGALAGLRAEVNGLARGRLERLLADLNLVTRDEFEAMRDVAVRAREAQAALEARVAALEAQLATVAKQDEPLPTKRPRAKAKPAANPAV